MTYRIIHRTSYEYAESVAISHHLLRLRPIESPFQKCHSHALNVSPEPRCLRSYHDYFGNAVTFITVEGSHTSLHVEARSIVDVSRRAWPAPGETPSWEIVRESSRGCQAGPALEAREFVFDSPFIRTGDAFAEFARPSFPCDRPVLEAVLDLTRRIYAEFKFEPKATHIATSPLTILNERRGVCQDFAQLQIACLRSLGLPARYVSGYIETIPAPGKDRLAGADASHGWVSFYCHGIGWIDVDPTNNILPSSQHVVIATGRDYGDISPVRGVIIGSGGHSLKVAVDMEPWPAVAPIAAAQDGEGVLSDENVLL